MIALRRGTLPDDSPLVDPSHQPSPEREREAESREREREVGEKPSSRHPEREGVTKCATLCELLERHCITSPTLPLRRATADLQRAISSALARAEGAALCHQPFLEAAHLVANTLPPPTVRTLDVGCIRVDGADLWPKEESEVSIPPLLAPMSIGEMLSSFSTLAHPLRHSSICSHSGSDSSPISRKPSLRASPHLRRASLRPSRGDCVAGVSMRSSREEASRRVSISEAKPKLMGGEDYSGEEEGSELNEQAVLESVKELLRDKRRESVEKDIVPTF